MKQKVFWRLVQALILVWLFVGGQALAAQSLEGSIVLAPNGTIYLISQNQKRGFPTPAVFHSHGYEFTQTIAATADDLALPQGPIMIYADGTLVKGSDPTVYTISNGKKLPFSSATVFLGLGYNFTNVVLDQANLLTNIPLGAVIDSFDLAHPAGTLLNDNGTIYLVTLEGKQGIPTLEVFNSYSYKFKNVVPINTSDKALTSSGLLAARGTKITPSVPETPTPEIPTNHMPSVPTISGYDGSLPKTDATYKVVSTDADDDILTYTLDWGDGSAKVVEKLASGVSFSATHDWTYIGDYTITVTVDDSKGGITIGTKKVIVDLDTSRFGSAVTVITPNGEGKYTQGQEIMIIWRRNWMPTGAYSKVDIYYSRGGLQQLIKSDALDSSYGWIPQGLIGAEDYKIVVNSKGEPGSAAVQLSDESDNYFSIEKVLGAKKSQ